MNMNVSLTDELASFVKAKVAAGRYTSSSEVVREALRLMEKVEKQEVEKLGYLRKAWQQGLDSGDAGEVDFAALKKEARARFTRRAREDLLDIWLYVAPRSSEALADQIYDRIEERCQLLTEHTKLVGRARKSLRTRARSSSSDGWRCIPWSTMARRWSGSSTVPATSRKLNGR